MIKNNLVLSIVLLFGFQASLGAMVKKGTHNEHKQANILIIKKLLTKDLTYLQKELPLLQMCNARNMPRRIKEFKKEIRELKDQILHLDELINDVEYEKSPEKKEVKRAQSPKRKSPERQEPEVENVDNDGVFFDLGLLPGGCVEKNKDSDDEQDQDDRDLQDHVDDGTVSGDDNHDEEEEEDKPVVLKKHYEKEAKRVSRSPSLQRRPSKSYSRDRELPQAPQKTYAHPCDPQRYHIVNDMIDGVPWDFWPYCVATGSPELDIQQFRAAYKTCKEKWILIDKRTEVECREFLRRGLEILEKQQANFYKGC